MSAFELRKHLAAGHGAEVRGWAYAEMLELHETNHKLRDQGVLLPQAKHEHEHHDA